MALRRQLHRYRCYLKLGARYYNPTTGRFTQPDPSGQETNTYAYASDNPTNNTDPTGLSVLTKILWGMTAVATVAAIAIEVFTPVGWVAAALEVTVWSVGGNAFGFGTVCEFEGGC